MIEMNMEDAYVQEEEWEREGPPRPRLGKTTKEDLHGVVQQSLA